ncbi:MAG: proteasome assembly chaperone family protein [Methanophagales archaeon]|nr:proteasome assembly chaperone family protein [Methanophagales archaeon]MCW3140801.1 proteasome assembly chaperone family protein [Methanophagales archaeon]
MEEIEVHELKKVKLNKPVMIEGLPGVGNVGKLVAEHMIQELEAEKIVEIYSWHFPPQVLVNSNGTVRLCKNELYAWKSRKLDLLIVSGDQQSVTNEGHYLIAEKLLDLAQQYDVSRIYTLGGYGIGQLVERQTVLGATNEAKLVEEMKKYGVEFREEEPGGSIVGASGLLLGLGKLKGIPAICLLGLTSGYLVDPKSAQAVLKILCQVLNLELDMQALEERAEEMEKVVERLKEMEQAQIPRRREEELGYIR